MKASILYFALSWLLLMPGSHALAEAQGQDVYGSPPASFGHIHMPPRPPEPLVLPPEPPALPVETPEPSYPSAVMQGLTGAKATPAPNDGIDWDETCSKDRVTPIPGYSLDVCKRYLQMKHQREMAAHRSRDENKKPVNGDDSSDKVSKVSLVKSGVWSAHMVKEMTDAEHPYSNIKQHDQDECMSIKQAATIVGLVDFAHKGNEDIDMQCSYSGLNHGDKKAHWKFACEYHSSWGRKEVHERMGGDTYLTVKDSEHLEIKMVGWLNQDGKYSNGTSKVTLTWKRPDPLGHCER